MSLNRLANINNQFQGEYKKVLCVCSAGLLRSPSAAVVLSSPPFNFNTRAAGADSEFALIPVDEVLLKWADEIVCMEIGHCVKVFNVLKPLGIDRKVVVLDIPDTFSYRDEELMKLIALRYQENGRHI